MAAEFRGTIRTDVRDSRPDWVGRYEPPFVFTGGTIRAVVIDVADQDDQEAELLLRRRSRATDPADGTNTADVSARRLYEEDRGGYRSMLALTAGALILGIAGTVGTPAATARPVSKPSSSDPMAQTELANRYAPVVELVDSGGSCGHGEPFEPVAVDTVLDNPDVALRGPWNGDNLVTVAPSAADLSTATANYYLDLPGNALSSACSYATWAAQVQRMPTVYARVVAQASAPGRLALQYWFFYLYNDFNDKHEGDWEMIQLDFHAATAQQALTVAPTETGYSQHEGAEQADWDSSKLQRVDGTHPVVYVALGSHANYYSARLYLGRSAAQGVGCDDTLGPSRAVRPVVAVIPQSSADYRRQFPWLAFPGRWGERHRAFDNGPTGPNTKPRWNAPFTWEEESWHSTAFAVPDGGVFGHDATSFFCTAVGAGSGVLNAVFANPSLVLAVSIALLAFVLWLASRTRWGPAVTFSARRRRPWGVLVSSALRLYTRHFRVFGGIGLLFVPVGLVVTALQYLLFHASGLSSLVHVAGESNAAVQLLANGLGAVFTLVGLTFVQAATAYAVAELDRGRSVTARAALARAVSKGRPLLAALVIAALVVGLLSLTLFAAIIGAYLVVRWSLLAQATMLEDDTPGSPLLRSMAATRGHFWRTASVTVFITVLCLLIGPLIGALLLFATSASFTTLNLVSALVDAALTPLAAITTTYLYFDLRVRNTLDRGEHRADAVLPAEI